MGSVQHQVGGWDETLMDRVREETPGCRRVLHLNNAGSSLPPRCVTDTVVDYLQAEALRGSYELAAESRGLAEGVYSSLARLIGGQPSEIALFDGSTRAWQSALNSLNWQRGDRIVTTQCEYPSSVFAYMHLEQKYGVEVHYVPDDEEGQVSVDALSNALNDRTRLITATHMPTYSGLISPVAEIGKLARQAGIPFLLDACQSVGQLHVDVEEIGCDMLASAGRKFLRGPRGTAFLWVREALIGRLVPERADNFSANWDRTDSMTLRNDARRFELYERSLALQLGLGRAADYAFELGTRTIEQRIVSLAAKLRQLLAQCPGVQVQDRGQQLGGIVTFTAPRRPAVEVMRQLLEGGVNVSLCTADSARRSFPQRGLSAVVRASVHYYNTDEELERFVGKLAVLVG